MDIVAFFNNLHWTIRVPGKLLAALGGGYVSNHPEIFPSWAVAAGAVVALWVGIAFLWQLLSAWREHKGKKRLRMDPQVILIASLVIALGAATWQWWRGTPPDPRIAALEGRINELLQEPRGPRSSADAATKLAAQTPPAAPFYSRADVERILEANYEVSNLLQQKAVPARNAAQSLLKEWQSILLNGGEPAFRQRLKEVRELTEALIKEGWAISDKYQHYNSEIGPVLGGMAFSGKFFAASSNFESAGENLPPVISEKTLSLLMPARDAYQQATAGLQQWMMDTSFRAHSTTEKFRLIADKAE
jgi:hypothetical protein